MRHRWVLGALLVSSILAGSRDATADGGRCVDVICSTKCVTHDVNFGGFCNHTEAYTTGCVQLFGPDCGSMTNTPCCTSPQTASGF
jgi:hypothetical protein